MTEVFSDYGLFVAKLVTVAAFAFVVFGLIVSMMRRGAQPQRLSVEHLNKRFEHLSSVLRRAVDGKALLKKLAKARQKERKRAEREKRRSGRTAKRIFVLDFKGDLRATATASLREEISAVLAVAKSDDSVLLRLENAGGAVHEHGLAASQLLRIRRKGIPLLIAVDKVAASGGYLMACCADRIMAAPFAIVGSIGVLAQLPNFHRFLEDRGIDFEQITAGRYKRTLTLFGKNTEEGREKMRADLKDVHELFKQQIAEHRPQVELAEVATGEHWYGLRALDLKLIDEIRTSDDFLVEAAEDHDLYHVSYKRHRPLPERLMSGAETLLTR